VEKMFASKLLTLGLIAWVLFSGVALTASAEFDLKRPTLALNGFVPDPIMPEECYRPEVPEDQSELRAELAGACRWFALAHVEYLLNAGVSPERTRTKKSELERAIRSTGAASEGLVNLLIRKGANPESLDSNNKTLFQITLEADLPYWQKKVKILALIGGGAKIDLEVVQKAKKLGQEYAHHRCMSREEWDQLEQIITDAQEMRDKRCSVTEFLPNPLAELVCVYERGPLQDEEIREIRCGLVEDFLPKVLAQVVVQYELGDEYEGMPALEDVPDEEPEGESLES
jgi:hypothetical protein